MNEDFSPANALWGHSSFTAGELESILMPVEFDGTGRGEEYNSLCEFIRNCPEVIGLADDFAVAMFALKLVWGNITPAVYAKAESRLREWFDNISEEDLSIPGLD